jgi:serine/threonine-protein kinase RsbW
MDAMPRLGPGKHRDDDPEGFRILVQARQAAVGDAIDLTLSRFGPLLTGAETAALHITLAEVLNNIVEHAYSGLPPGVICVDLRLLADGLHCRVEDQGHPMPESGLPRGDLPAVDVGVPDLPEGGFGWRIIRSLATDLTHVRTGGTNRLAFRLPPCPD